MIRLSRISWSRYGARACLCVAALVMLMSTCAQRGSASALRIEVPAADLDAEVYVDGSYVGVVDALHEEAAAGPLLLAPGVHRVELRKPGRFPVQRTITVDRRPAPEIVVEGELLEDPQ